MVVAPVPVLVAAVAVPAAVPVDLAPVRVQAAAVAVAAASVRVVPPVVPPVVAVAVVRARATAAGAERRVPSGVRAVRPVEDGSPSAPSARNSTTCRLRPSAACASSTVTARS